MDHSRDDDILGAHCRPNGRSFFFSSTSWADMEASIRKKDLMMSSMYLKVSSLGLVSLLGGAAFSCVLVFSYSSRCGFLSCWLKNVIDILSTSDSVVLSYFTPSLTKSSFQPCLFLYKKSLCFLLLVFFFLMFLSVFFLALSLACLFACLLLLAAVSMITFPCFIALLL